MLVLKLSKIFLRFIAHKNIVLNIELKSFYNYFLLQLCELFKKKYIYN